MQKDPRKATTQFLPRIFFCQCATNVVNNPQSIFFDNNNFEHMACGFVADWNETGTTEIRICDLKGLKSCEIFC